MPGTMRSFHIQNLRVAPNTFGQIGAIQHDARAAQSIRSRVRGM